MQLIRAIFILITFCSTLCFANEESQLKKIRIGILPIKNFSKPEFDWIAYGTRDTLNTIFTNNSNFISVEKSEIDLLLKSHSREGFKPGFVSAEVLLLGSYTILNEKIKIVLRMVHAEKGHVLNKSVISIKGDLKDILKLQLDLVQDITHALHTEVSLEELRRDAPPSYLNYQYLNRGKVAFDKKDFLRALDYFLQAQKNSDRYDAISHHWEGRTRIALAQSKAGKEKLKEEEQHIAKFRKDAGQAARAFFDLAYAQQAYGQYEQAIDSYNRYLKWIDESDQLVVWEEYFKNKWYGGDFAFINSGGMNHETRFGFHDYYNNLDDAYSYYRSKNVYLSNDKVYYWKGKTIFCRHLKTGKVFWKKNLTRKTNSSRINTSFFLQNGIFYLLSDQDLLLCDNKTGQTIQSIKRIDMFPKRHYFDERLFIDSKGKHAIVSSISSEIIKRDPSKPYPPNIYKVMTAIYHLDTGKHSLLFEYTIPHNITFSRYQKRSKTLPRLDWREKFPVYSRYDDKLQIAIEDQLHVIDLREGKYHTENYKPIFYHPKDFKEFRRYHKIGTKGMFIVANSTSTSKGLFNRFADKQMIKLNPNFNTWSWSSSGNELVLFNRGFAQKYDIHTGQLLWKYHFAHSRSQYISCMSDGFLIFNMGPKIICVNSNANLGQKQNQINSFYQRALCYFKLGMKEKAFQDLNHVTQLNPRHADAHYMLAQVYLSMKQTPIIQNKILRSYDKLTDFGTQPNKLQEAHQYFKQFGALRKINLPSHQRIGIFNGEVLYVKEDRTLHNLEGKTLLEADSKFNKVMMTEDYLVLSNYKYKHQLNIHDLKTGKELRKLHLPYSIIEDISYKKRWNNATMDEFLSYKNNLVVSFNDGQDYRVYLFNCENGSKSELLSIQSPHQFRLEGIVRNNLLFLHYKTKELKEAFNNDQIFMIDLKQNKLLWKKVIPSLFHHHHEHFMDLTSSRLVLCHNHSNLFQVIDSLTGKVIHQINSQFDFISPISIQHSETIFVRLHNKIKNQYYKSKLSKVIQVTGKEAISLEPLNRSLFSMNSPNGYRINHKLTSIEVGNSIHLIDDQFKTQIKRKENPEFNPYLLKFKQKQFLILEKYYNKTVSIYEFDKQSIPLAWFY